MLLDRRILSVPYRGSVSFRHQPNLFPREILIGRSFGPFSRGSNNNTSSATSPLTTHQQQMKSTEIEDTGIYLEGNQRHAGHQPIDDDSNKLVTSTEQNIKSTQPTIEINHKVTTEIDGVRNVNCPIGSYFGNRTRTKESPPQLTSQYKFLRRQFSMDQKPHSFQLKPSVQRVVASGGNNSKWRKQRYDSVDVISAIRKRESGDFLVEEENGVDEDFKEVNLNEKKVTDLR